MADAGASAGAVRAVDARIVVARAEWRRRSPNARSPLNVAASTRVRTVPRAASRARRASRVHGADRQRRSRSGKRLGRPSRYALARRRALVREVLAHAALVVLGDERALVLVAAVEERQLEGEARVVEQRRVLRPGHDRARRHHRGQIAVGEAAARQVGERHHRARARPALGGAVFGAARQHHVDLAVVRQVVQRDDDVPAVHLALVERLRAVIEAGGVAEADVLAVANSRNDGCGSMTRL